MHSNYLFTFGCVCVCVCAQLSHYYLVCFQCTSTRISTSRGFCNACLITALHWDIILYLPTCWSIGLLSATCQHMSATSL